MPVKAFYLSLWTWLVIYPPSSKKRREKKLPCTHTVYKSSHLLLLVQIMTFESSINRLNYFKIVILIYTDIVLITQAEIKALSGAVDVELNRARSSWGLPGLSCRSQKRNDILPLMNWQHAQT